MPLKIVKKSVSKHKILILPNPETGIKTGMEDFVSVKNVDGSRSHVQKRSFLCNLNELYSRFTSEHKSLKISYS